MKHRQQMIPGCILLLCGCLTGTAVQAQDPGEELVARARCLACHQMQESSLGPSWLAIAARHAERKDLMLEVLAGKIVRGGGGNWGLVPMVPNQNVTVAEARSMAQWILALQD